MQGRRKHKKDRNIYQENLVAVSPLFATHTDRSQITENPATLSPFLATHTDLSPVNLVFATHTKTTGVYTNNSHSGTPTSPLPPVTSHKSPVTPLRLPRIMSAPNQGDNSR